MSSGREWVCARISKRASIASWVMLSTCVPLFLCLFHPRVASLAIKVPTSTVWFGVCGISLFQPSAFILSCNDVLFLDFVATLLSLLTNPASKEDTLSSSLLDFVSSLMICASWLSVTLTSLVTLMLLFFQPRAAIFSYKLALGVFLWDTEVNAAKLSTCSSSKAGISMYSGCDSTMKTGISSSASKASKRAGIGLRV